MYFLIDTTQNPSLLPFIRDLLYRAYAFLISIPDLFLGSNSWWTVLVAVFVVGTIINLITGDDDDIVDDD